MYSCVLKSLVHNNTFGIILMFSFVLKYQPTGQIWRRCWLSRQVLPQPSEILPPVALSGQQVPHPYQQHGWHGYGGRGESVYSICAAAGQVPGGGEGDFEKRTKGKIVDYFLFVSFWSVNFLHQQKKLSCSLFCILICSESIIYSLIEFVFVPHTFTIFFRCTMWTCMPRPTRCCVSPFRNTKSKWYIYCWSLPFLSVFGFEAKITIGLRFWQYSYFPTLFLFDRQI